MKSHDFLHLYKQRSNPIKITKDTSEKTTADVKDTELNVMEPESKNGESNHSSSEATSGPSPTSVDSKAQLCELERRRALLSSCTAGEAGDPVSSSGAGFFNGGWRGQLCRCDGCRQLYSSSGVEFLLEKSDPVAVYEGKAERRPSTLDAGMAALGSSLDRVQQVEAFHRKPASCLVNYDLLTALNERPRGTLMLILCCRVQ